MRVHRLALVQRSIFLILVFFAMRFCMAEPIKEEIGCYLENLRNFDYLGGVFRADLYLWIDAPVSVHESLDNLDFVRARPTWTSSVIKYDEKGTHYECCKYMVEVNHDWDISRFPFDTQRLRIKVEDLDRSVTELNFIIDPNSGFAKNLIPAEWEVISKKIYVSNEQYDTNFGEPSDGNHKSQYSRMIVEVILSRHAISLFFKMVAGAYAAFAAICLTFWLSTDVPTYVSARVGLIVGCLFGTIINQRVVEAVVGRSSYFTHIDAIHLLTLGCCILAGIVTLISTKLSVKQQVSQALLLDRIAFWFFVIVYLGFNTLLVGYDLYNINTTN